jgi:hypothetical protein
MVKRTTAATIPEPSPPPVTVDPPAVIDDIRPGYRGVGQGSNRNDEKETPKVLPEPSSPPVPSTAPPGKVKSEEDRVF